MEQRVNYVYVIKQLELGLRPRFVELCAAEGMSAAQYTALTVLERRPGITSSELARRSFVRAQTMAITLEPLLSGGLVRRERDPENGRRMLLFLTATGAAAIERLTKPLAALEEQLVSGFTAAERVQFADLLRRSSHSLAEAANRARSQDAEEPAADAP